MSCGGRTQIAAAAGAAEAAEQGVATWPNAGSQNTIKNVETSYDLPTVC